jgi:glycosyltransferase involved in cell wall biosynthesis
MADRDDIPVVHVTHFNRLYWDCGRAPTRVLEHGIPDPGLRYDGRAARAAVLVNEPLRRGRVTGTDLVPTFAGEAPLDVFGMGTRGLPQALGLSPRRVRTYEDLPQDRLHAELARRRVYLHLSRWTSLGLSLIEAMHLGLPVVVLATTEAAEAVPPEAGAVSTRVDELRLALRDLLHDLDAARAAGLAARAAAVARYGLPRFLDDLDLILKEVTA